MPIETYQSVYKGLDDYCEVVYKAIVQTVQTLICINQVVTKIKLTYAFKHSFIRHLVFE